MRNEQPHTSITIPKLIEKARKDYDEMKQARDDILKLLDGIALLRHPELIEKLKSINKKLIQFKIDIDYLEKIWEINKDVDDSQK